MKTKEVKFNYRKGCYEPEKVTYDGGIRLQWNSPDWAYSTAGNTTPITSAEWVVFDFGIGSTSGEITTIASTVASTLPV